MQSPVEPKRIRQFRLGLCKQIPKFPNTRETLAALEAKSLGSVLVDYANWASRLIPPRPRHVTIEPSLTADSRWKRLSADTKVLLRKVSDGVDLGPHLSLGISRGFTARSETFTEPADRWDDKDLLLNVMGYHHLHLSQTIEAAGHTKRTDEVLFAQVDRTTFKAIGFFDHSVFETRSAVTQTMTAERERLWRLKDERNSRTRPPGIYMDNLIATSGHSVQHTDLAARYSRLVHSIDPKLDNLAFRTEFFPTLPHATVKSMKLIWNLYYLDLGLIDRTSDTFFVLQEGPV